MTWLYWMIGNAADEAEQWRLYGEDYMADREYDNPLDLEQRGSRCTTGCGYCGACS